jgi:hypothetical protein
MSKWDRLGTEAWQNVRITDLRYKDKALWIRKWDVKLLQDILTSAGTWFKTLLICISMVETRWSTVIEL